MTKNTPDLDNEKITLSERMQLLSQSLNGSDDEALKYNQSAGIEIGSIGKSVFTKVLETLELAGEPLDEIEKAFSDSFPNS